MLFLGENCLSNVVLIKGVFDKSNKSTAFFSYSAAKFVETFPGLALPMGLWRWIRVLYSFVLAAWTIIGKKITADLKNVIGI